jgi:hypothetical protein
VALTSGNAMAPELGAILVGQSTNEQPTKRLLARQPGERICPLDRFRPGQTRIFDTKTAELLGEGGYLSKTSNRISGMRACQESRSRMWEAATVSYTATFPAFRVVDSRHDTP